MGKTSAKTSGLVPQPHGGALKPGGDGVSGGRPSSELRARLRGALSERIHIATDIADAGTPGDQLRALEFMGKYGLGTNKGHDEALVAQLARVTAEVFAGDERLGALREAWVRVIGGHVRGIE